MNECESHRWTKTWARGGEMSWICLACGLTQPTDFGCEHSFRPMVGPYAGKEFCTQCGTTQPIMVPDLRDRTAIETWLSA